MRRGCVRGALAALVLAGLLWSCVLMSRPKPLEE